MSKDIAHTPEREASLLLYPFAWSEVCHKQSVLIYSGKPNNVDKTDEDRTWWPQA